ncbi:TPA: sugar MFS transporter [Pseudomonas putida]|uniref:sugar MFS transporter n=1 Tax=Pseudomonas putida TaxID=303 RepID=UPI00110D1FB3|nr:sugar MFS transporter [Pseudomonas putida]MDD1992763.1 sugar MFS transporter [Pseudomonas putida]HDS0918396.1 sugar MFS transporter [Pseudomonas putida]HDS0931677.1 sugar MFS transporter [Pseudomonas putida]HDS1782305.1 sugar MFS transporter [Pseudomonas putida]HDS3796954.1 sugar MFS transporter [Pseudomonas putida]
MQAVYPADAGSTTITKGKVQRLSFFVFTLFFIFGSITSLNDVLIPKLKSLFSLSYTEAMLVQSAFFFAYFIASVPAGILISRIGYMRAAVVGLLTMAAGCLLFIPATKVGLFAAFLGALFILAAGVTVVQVVTNPLISLLGPAKTAHSRVTFGHAFNSLGTTIAPFLGAILILGSLNAVDPATLAPEALKAFLAEEAEVISNTYAGIAAALLVVACVVWAQRKQIPASSNPKPSNPLAALNLLKRPRFAFGAACLFFYVGAEVAIGSLLTNFLMLDSTFGFDAELAGKHVAYYWGGAMVGRFIGAVLLRRFAPGLILAAAAGTVILLIMIAATSTGATAGWAILAVGLFNSIMFPTIFALASEGLGARAAEGSGLICCAIVGGAIVPPLTGFAADLSTLALSLMVPAVCYAAIALYGFYTRRSDASTSQIRH